MNWFVKGGQRVQMYGMSQPILSVSGTDDAGAAMQCDVRHRLKATSGARHGAWELLCRYL